MSSIVDRLEREAAFADLRAQEAEVDRLAALDLEAFMAVVRTGRLTEMWNEQIACYRRIGWIELADAMESG